MKMSELTKKLNIGSFESFSNEQEIITKQNYNINLIINENVFDQFRAEAMNFFTNQKQTNNFSNANFMKVCIQNVYKIFLEKYSEILPLNEEFEKFYKKRGRASIEHLEKYNHFKQKRYCIGLDQEFYEKYFEVMHTFYIKELKPKGVYKYSVNFFFYDMFNIIKENIENLENIEQFK